MKLAKIGVLGVIAVLMFAACSPSPGASGAAGGKTIKIGTELPISNAAGLLQCSPANTNTGLTSPPDSLQYRPNNPDKINYIRLAAPDSIQGPAGADYTYTDLGAKNVYILDDTEAFGVGVGDSFSARFTELGGTVTKRDSAPKSTTRYTPLFTAAVAAKPA